ncbi:MAG TPA: hypothetical protein VF939_18770 [Puia sp.]
MFKRIKSIPFFIRLLHWEYWPFHIVYFPIYPVWVWYCIKARSFFFFGASNPTIRNGGFLMESKKEIYDLIPDRYKPLTLFFAVNTSLNKVISSIRNHDLKYPLIIKPDIGMQGKAVIKVYNERELSHAVSRFTVNYIIQPFIPYPKEMGIFYVHYPEDKKGRITGIVEKEFLKVIGDGVSSIEQLLNQDPRYILQIPALRKSMAAMMHTVPGKDEELVLVPYGNHVRGSLFLDHTEKNNSKLELLIDKACQLIDGFYYGRLDIRYKCFKELIEDKNWCIIELNGAGSEPTHMYDPKHSLFFAWKEIISHWGMLYKVSMQNKTNGAQFMSFASGKAMFKENRAYLRKLTDIHFYPI